jgi:hypothetical protein
LSAFTFGDEFRNYLATNGATRGYAGPCGALWLWFDLDDADDPDRVLAAARRLCAGLADRYSLDEDDLLIFFSGSKGYHIGLPLTLCGSPAPSLSFHRVARRFAEAAAGRAGVTIDAGVYDRVRIFRAPNSRHPKTGLHKRLVGIDELLSLSGDAIRRISQDPEAFDVPVIADDASAVHAVAAADWADAINEVESEEAIRSDRRATMTGATLNRLTRDFLRDGATAGDRHRLLFSAAANLAEFGASFELAFALLSEPALDSGLSPADVSRQIRCGIEGGRS